MKINKRNFLKFITNNTVQILLVVVFIFLTISNSNFRQFSNFRNILLQSSFIGIGACGMTALLISGELDLSIAYILGLCGIALVKIEPVLGLPLTIITVIIFGIFLGAINGIVVTKIQIPAFIATLGMGYIYLGIAFIWGQGQVIPVSGFVRILGSKIVLGIPIPFWVMIFMFIIFYCIFRFFTYGRYIRAVGSNYIPSRLTGLSVDRIKIFAFMSVGACTAVAAVLLGGMLSSVSPIMAKGYELNVIAAAVIGGTSLKGGKGTIIGSFTGAILFTVIVNALNMLNVTAYWQYVVTGLILILTLAINNFKKDISLKDI